MHETIIKNNINRMYALTNADVSYQISINYIDASIFYFLYTYSFNIRSPELGNAGKAQELTRNEGIINSICKRYVIHY